MALYEFLCKLCGKREEHIRRHDAPAPTCTTSTQCSVEPMTRLVSVPGVAILGDDSTGAQKAG